jgi:hypothetical protein
MRNRAVRNAVVAFVIGGRLRQIGLRGAQLGLGALNLQLQVLGSSRATTSPARTRSPTLTIAATILPADAEAEVGLMTRPHRRRRTRGSSFSLSKGDALHLHRPLALDRGARFAASQPASSSTIARAAKRWGRRHRISPVDHRSCDDDEIA